MRYVVSPPLTDRIFEEDLYRIEKPHYCREISVTFPVSSRSVIKANADFFKCGTVPECLRRRLAIFRRKRRVDGNRSDNPCWPERTDAVKARNAQRSVVLLHRPCRRAGRFHGLSERLPSMRPAIRDATVIVLVAATRSCDWPAGRAAAAPFLHAKTRPLLVEADRVERSAVPANHVPMLLVRRIEDRLQEVHETVRAADVLRRTASGPVHEGRIFPVRVAAANLLDDYIVALVVAIVVGVDEPIHAA